ncbi:hypothetical protein D3C87_110670 [compost metagenome]
MHLRLFFLTFLFSMRVFASPSWGGEVVSQQVGSCEHKNLAFSAVRFSKIPLNKKFEGRNVFLRLIFFFKEDGSYAVRANEQVLVGCVGGGSSGKEEQCSYQQLSDQWLAGQWVFGTSDLLLDYGAVSKKGTEAYRDYQLNLHSFPMYSEILNHLHAGTVILVNFDSTGRNAGRICFSDIFLQNTDDF